MFPQVHENCVEKDNDAECKTKETGEPFNLKETEGNN